MTAPGARPRLVLASRNEHKVVELRRMLAESGLAVELLGIDAFDDVPEVAETEPTFAGNVSGWTSIGSKSSNAPATTLRWRSVATRKLIRKTGW